MGKTSQPLLAICLLMTIFAQGESSWWSENKSPSDKKPNVILMFADDMGSDDLGYVNSEVISPTIDALANAGVKLSNNYVMNVCTPTRHAAMTGRYPFKTMLGHIVIFPLQQLCTPINIKMLPQYFKDNGYHTMATGKWHLGFCREECLPTSRGFDDFYGLYQGEQDYYEHTSGPGSIERYDWRDGTKIDWSVKGIFNTYLMNDWVVDKIKNYKSDDPFFLYLAWTTPHTPLECPEKYYNLYDRHKFDNPERQDYLGLVSAMDDGIKNVTDALKEAGHWDNTIIIFSSDNGGEHGYAASNGELRGSKGSMFEGGIKALGFVYSSWLKKSGYTNDGLFHVTDWLPTLMSIIGAENFDQKALKIDGYDQSDMIMNGGESIRNEVVFNIDMHPMSTMGQSAVRIGDFKLLWGGYGATDGYYVHKNLTLFYKDNALRAEAGLGDYGTKKRAAFDFSAGNQEDMTTMLGDLFRFSKDNIDSGRVYLFDLKNDPNEYNNLAEDDTYADKLKELKEFVLDLIKNEYIEPSDEAKKNNLASANDPAYNGTWSTGWCNDVDLKMPGE